MATGYGLNRNMGHDKMTTTDQLDNLDMSMGVDLLYYLRLEIMYRRYLRYKQGIKKNYPYPFKTSLDRKSWLLIMGLAETSNYA